MATPASDHPISIQPEPRRVRVLAGGQIIAETKRALRLREACAVVARDGWPEDLRALPGIGPYTAAAVGAFAFGRDELPIDTNVRRVLDRGLNRSAGGTRWAAAMAVGAAVLAAPLMTLQFTATALASPGPAPFASDDDAEVIVFDLRVPPREPNTLPKSAQETSDRATAGGESPGDAAPASIEKKL